MRSAVSLSMPTVRYEPERAGGIVAALKAASTAISRSLGQAGGHEACQDHLGVRVTDDARATATASSAGSTEPAAARKFDIDAILRHAHGTCRP